MNLQIEVAISRSEGRPYGHTATDGTDVTSVRSPSMSSNATRTPPSTPATSRTELANPRPPPPRRHTDKPNFYRRPSIDLKPASPSHNSPFNDYGFAAASNPYLERSYLFQSLQDQGERARRLLQRLSSAEERLARGCLGPGEPRKIRKEIRLLRIKIDETGQQERLTVLRLGDLYVDIQNRERWMQIQQERIAALMAQQQQQQPTFISPQYPAPSADHASGEKTVSSSPDPVLVSPSRPPPTAASCFSSFFPPSPSTCLSPLSPSFVPGLPFEEAFRSRRPSLGKYGDGQSGQEGTEANERGRSYTPASPASRTSSLRRPSDRGPGRNRRASVPAVRTEWADKSSAEESVNEEYGQGLTT